MPGPKPTPTKLKLVRGNPGKRALNKAEPAPVSDMPQAPAWLSDVARGHFDMLVERIDGIKLASMTHSEAIAMAAMRIEEIEVCTAAIAQHGSTYTTVNQAGGEMIRSRPEVAQRSEAMRHLQSLLSEFGLTPAAASKVQVPSKGKKDNPFSALLKGKRQ